MIDGRKILESQLLRVAAVSLPPPMTSIQSIVAAAEGDRVDFIVSPPAGDCFFDSTTFTAGITGVLVNGDGGGDGASDFEDVCPASNLGPMVRMDGCDFGVDNPVDAAGCSFADEIDATV